MSHHHVRNALQKLSDYDGSLPLHVFLREAFRRDSRMGSRDRRVVRSLCYSWFRCAILLQGLAPERRMVWAAYLTSQCNPSLLETLLASGGREFDGIVPSDNLGIRLEQAASRLEAFEANLLFPFDEWLSEGLDKDSFRRSMLIQPLVWIRVNTGYVEDVLRVLLNNEIPVVVQSNDGRSMGLPPETSLESTGIIDQGWAEVQDLSSQQTVEMMEALEGEVWYDACAASGGKSLLLKDRYPGISLVVSDSRKSILDNLDVRFLRNRVTSYRSFIMDLLDGTGFPEWLQPDGIIADVPCSGSGTWSRTPEQLYYFSRAKLDHYIALQQAITQRLSGLLKSGGKLVYVTCSVFREENEGRVQQIAADFQFEIEKSRLIQGAGVRADTMYCALLRKK